MTVITFDGNTVAADKRASDCGLARTVTKIEKFGASILAMTGNWDHAVELREWYKAGARLDEFTDLLRECDATLIVFTRKAENCCTVHSYSNAPYPMLVEETQCAFGSGRDFAEAAMHLGKTAREAVEIACHFQTDCGNGVDSLTLA